MGHTVHPYAHRLGILRDWKSRWFADRKQYKTYLKGDVLLREFLTKKLRGFLVAGVDIERSQKMFRIIIHTARPGMIIGRSGEGMQKLRVEIIKEMKRRKVKLPQDFKIDVVEVPAPEASAPVVAMMVAEGIEKRLPFRRVLKQTIEKVMANKSVQGAKIYLTGRLGGGDMARDEFVKRGGIPLQTLRADIDFAREKAYMTYGVIGIKVWIYKGLVFGEKKTAK